MRHYTLLLCVAAVLAMVAAVACGSGDEPVIPDGYIAGPDDCVGATVELVEVRVDGSTEWLWTLRVEALNNAVFPLTESLANRDNLQDPAIDGRTLSDGEIIDVRVDYYRHLYVQQNRVPPVPNAGGQFHLCQ